MSEEVQDDLWAHFVPLWTDLRKIAPRLLLAGGYGLFLKQQWLLSQMRVPSSAEVRTVVELNNWKEQTPRATKDFDFLISVDLIASAEEQRRLNEVLKKHGFEVVPANARWQFVKGIGEGRQVVLDFHAPTPAEERSDLRVESRRVKPQPSLGQTGVHDRENPEARGSELHPFSFRFKELEIVLPNPVTLAVMKLTAMRDRWLASQDTSKSDEIRELENRQARKHAEDVFRIVAMMTREESATTGIVLDAVSERPVFTEAKSTFADFFKADAGWGSQVVAGWWQPEDFQTMKDVLAKWFALPE